MVGGAWRGKRRGDLPDSFDFHFQICSQLSVLSVNELVTLCLSQACNVVKFTYGVVLNWKLFCFQRDIGQYLETYVVVTIQGKGATSI